MQIIPITGVDSNDRRRVMHYLSDLPLRLTHYRPTTILNTIDGKIRQLHNQKTAIDPDSIAAATVQSWRQACPDTTVQNRQCLTLLDTTTPREHGKRSRERAWHCTVRSVSIVRNPHPGSRFSLHARQHTAMLRSGQTHRRQWSASWLYRVSHDRRHVRIPVECAARCYLPAAFRQRYDSHEVRIDSCDHPANIH